MAAKRSFDLVTPEQLDKTQPDINWSYCFLCQNGDTDNLQYPCKRTGFNPEQNMYHTISKNLFEFQKLGALPMALEKRISLCGTSADELTNKLMSDKACFHKSCASSYNKQKLERKRKSFEESKDKDTSGPSRKMTRLSANLKNFVERCFFCEKDDSNDQLHECLSIPTSNRIRKMAEALNDSKILGKLSEGDMIATEAKYHVKCFLNLFNRYRKHTRATTTDSNNEFNFIEGNAISEVVCMIEEVLSSSDGSPVFVLRDLVNKYKEILLRFGATKDFVEKVHSTRFKQAILKKVGCLCEKRKGRDTLLTLEDHVGHAIFQASQMTSFDEGIILSKAANIVRRHLFATEEVFTGDLTKEKQTASVPKELLFLIGSILERTSQKGNVSKNTNNVALNISQLVKFNAVKTKRKDSSTHIRHSSENEPPLPVKIGLMVHSKTRKKSIIDELSSKGICISYNRVTDIEDSIAYQLCEQYLKENLVCPYSLLRNLFTFAALDNVDHDPTSSTAKESFHGTSLTIFQQHDGDEVKKQPFKIKETERKTIQLPEHYTDIKPAKNTKPEPPQTPSVEEDASKITTEVFEWLENLAKLDEKPSGDSGQHFSFSAFHSQQMKDDPVKFKTHSALLPIFLESVNSPAMVKHCMEIIKNLTRHLNESQSQTVITGDQPVYALGKQVQWMYPEQFGDVLWMMGPLHIEMAFLDAIGDWYDGSGWTDVFERAKVTTTGRIESFLKGNKVKRTRYAHQISLASLLHIAMSSFQKQNVHKDYATWKEARRKESANAEFWFTAIELESLYFLFIKSIREGDFDMFLQCLKAMMPWFFALDHTHYSRWLSVFVKDLCNLKFEGNDTYEAFKKGFFTVRKTNRVFSNIGIDQAHEQNNKILKTDGGVIGILDNPKALLKWAVSGPIISEMLRSEEDQTTKHHEDTKALEEAFLKDRAAFISSMQGYGNPFEEEEKNLVHLTSRHVLDDTATKSVRDAKQMGESQFATFLKDRLTEGKASLYDNLPRNNLPLFRQKYILNPSKSKQKIATLNTERRLYANLFIACQSRKGDLDNFFAHENHAFPVSISEYGKLRKATSKSDFIQCLETKVDVKHEAPAVLMKVVDGAAFVNMNRPQTSDTYGNYCKDELVRKLKSAASNLKRLDLVFDVYKHQSLKGQTRENRGKGIRISIRKETKIYKDFQKFMRNDANKTDLFKMISQTTIEEMNGETTVVATIGDGVLCNANTDTSDIAPCNHEEADTRVFLHVQDGSRNGIKKISIITVDTDVVVIAIQHFEALDLEELWIEFGVGKSRKYIPVHECANILGGISNSLIFWHSLTGCDTVSSFNGKGKKTAWKVLRLFEEGQDTFARLSRNDVLDEKDLSVIERFVILMYHSTSELENVNDCRRALFTKKAKPVESIPPTKDALIQHAKRAMLQTITWKNSLVKQQPEHDPEEWGWTLKDGKYEPLWMTQGEASKEYRELYKCGCKKRCAGNCKCKKEKYSCTELCNCGGNCP